jgi:hypothetical protein
MSSIRALLRLASRRGAVAEPAGGRAAARPPAGSRSLACRRARVRHPSHEAVGTSVYEVAAKPTTLAEVVGFALVSSRSPLRVQWSEKVTCSRTSQPPCRKDPTRCHVVKGYYTLGGGRSLALYGPAHARGRCAAWQKWDALHSRRHGDPSDAPQVA